VTVIDATIGALLAYACGSAAWRLCWAEPQHSRFLTGLLGLVVIIAIGYLNWHTINLGWLRDVRFIMASIIIIWTVRAWPLK
jgi:hypothetical protein